MRSWCFDSQESGGVYDREYGSADIREVVYKIVGNGVYATPTTNMQVVADTGMTISVQPGSCWVNGAYGCIDAAETLTFDASASGRYDIVVARFDLSLSYRSIRLAVIKGTEGSSTAPTPTQTASVYDLQLAKVNVRAGATSILQSDITDTREDNTVCGVVNGVAYQAAALQDQIDDLDTAKQDKTNSLATETVLDDADSLPFYDASATAHKKTLWSNIKARLKAYFDTIYAAKINVSITETPVGGTFDEAIIIKYPNINKMWINLRFSYHGSMGDTVNMAIARMPRVAEVDRALSAALVVHAPTAVYSAYAATYTASYPYTEIRLIAHEAVSDVGTIYISGWIDMTY